MINYDEELNPTQKEAACSTEGPYLVIAGAGSGKTRVLVFRTAYLVERGVRPENILLLTFTRRAAREMLSRASGILDDRCQQVSGGTFHSFANTILRKYGERMGLPRHFTILDQADSENTVHMIRTHMGLGKNDKRFPKKNALFSVISKCVNKCIDLESVIYEEYPHFMEYSASIEKIHGEYTRYKKSMALADYDDLLVYLRDLLASDQKLREALSDYYRYIMVDEYQDTNKIQAEIVRLLTCRHDNIMVVGDDSQSIYSFRGAHFRNIIDFPKIFPKARVITLEENYRSSQPILDLTNEVISAAREKFDKNLFTQNAGENLPIYVEVPDENTQSRYITERITQLRAEGVKFSEMAVLFRSGWHSNDLEVQLAAQGVSFVKYGGQKFVESAHIKDALSFLRVVQNPGHDVSWLRILTMLKGIGAKTAQQIVDQIKIKGLLLSPAILSKRPELAKIIHALRDVDRDDEPNEILVRCLEAYYPLLMDQYDDYDKRMNDLESLEKIASRYNRLEDFLADMALEPPEKSLIDQNIERPDDAQLILSTIHSAKGLEWHSVFVIFLAEGYLPSYRAINSEEAIEEERRLFYVATTRAKKNLFLLRPQVDRSPRRGPDASMYTRVSRFLGEGDILRKYVKVEGGFVHPHAVYDRYFDRQADEDYDDWA